MTKDNEKIATKAYVTARHNMTTDQMDTAIAQATIDAETARKQAEHHEAVLTGYRKARKERGTKTTA